MEVLEKQLKFRFKLGLYFIIGGILGGLLLGFGLYYWIIVMWAFGAAFLLAAFYGITLSFSMIVPIREKLALVRLINKGLTGVSKISKSLGKRQKAVVRLISECISKGYLEGYSLSVDMLEIVPITKEVIVKEYKCPGCGRLLNLNVDHECPYCGFKLSKEDLQ